jgi:hypothetical protein
VRQGDPISPFLFIIGLEALHVAFEKAVLEGRYSIIKLPNSGPSVSHLFYADDAIFLGEWSEENVHILAWLLRCFNLASGLKINFEKCKMVGI